MPNWVRNNITVKRVDGKNINVKEFFDMIGGSVDEDYTVNSIIKEPLYLCFDEEELGKENTLSTGRYNWRTSMWGVKWDATIITKGEFSGLDFVNLVSSSFDTAWCAPLPALIILSEALGEDYNVTLEATDEFLGNHCDYSLVINNGDIEEIPIEGDYEEWWSNIWGIDLEEEGSNFEGDSGSTVNSSTSLMELAFKHSNNLDHDIQVKLSKELSKELNYTSSNIRDTGEGNLWELELEDFTITFEVNSETRLLVDCIVVYKPNNEPVGLSEINTAILQTLTPWQTLKLIGDLK